MSGWIDKYRQAVLEMEEFTRLKIERIEGLQRYYRRQGKDQTSLDYLVDADSLVGYYSGQAQKRAIIAAAYGPMAILEMLGERGDYQNTQ